MSEAPSQTFQQTLSFDLDTVREVAQLLRESELGEICIETTDQDAAPARLFLRRTTSTLPAAVPAYPLAGEPQISTEALDAAGDAEETGTSAVPTTTVTSPAVGLFRPAKTPVKEGDAVKAGQVVGAVESMRVPNEVTAPVAGRVLELRAADGQGVEYGQILLVIEETA